MISDTLGSLPRPARNVSRYHFFRKHFKTTEGAVDTVRDGPWVVTGNNRCLIWQIGTLVFDRVQESRVSSGRVTFFTNPRQSYNSFANQVYCTLFKESYSFDLSFVNIGVHLSILVWVIGLLRFFSCVQVVVKCWSILRCCAQTTSPWSSTLVLPH